VDAAEFSAASDAFFQDYNRGTLDIETYLRFILAPLKGVPMQTLEQWRRDFMETMIRPIMLPRAMALVEKHRSQGDTLLIITSTNAFVTRPIADALGIDNFIACEAQIRGGLYTGEPEGTPSYREGKVTRLGAWRAAREQDLEGAWFYSDSHNDLPLLEQVDRPVAVDPDDTLRRHARERGWPIISLRD